MDNPFVKRGELEPEFTSLERRGGERRGGEIMIRRQQPTRKEGGAGIWRSGDQSDGYTRPRGGRVMLGEMCVRQLTLVWQNKVCKTVGVS